MSSPKKIAIVVDPFALARKGGEHACELAREFLGRGHCVRAFGAPPEAIAQSSEGLGLSLRQFAPDAVLAYDTLSPAAWLGARTTRRLGVPLVLVEVGHGADDSWHARSLRRVGDWFWGRMVRRATSAVIAIDPLAQERVLQQGFEAARVRLVPPGVDLEIYRPGLSSALVQRHHVRGRVILYLGHFSPGRGLETLIAAFGRSLAQAGDWTLVLAGEGPLRPHLRAQIDRLGIGSNVHWLPEPTEAELPGLLGASTLLAVPGEVREVRGQNIPKALACGLPVLCSDLPALHYLVQPGSNGLVAKAGDQEAWCAALRRVAMAPELRRRWSLAARASAEEVLAWKRVGAIFDRELFATRATTDASLALADEARAG